MSEQTPEPQFDRMEPRSEAAANTCSACQRSIPDTYFEANGRIFCEPCRDALMASLSGGSSAARLLKGVGFGIAAAVVSAVVWYAIVKLTGYQLGIIAIAVGFAVGAAVRVGAEQRGGWAYQTIAVVLTYLAIAASYVPLFLVGCRAEAAALSAVVADADRTGDPESAGAAPAAEFDERMMLVGSIVGALVMPVLQATEGTGIIGLLIVGFALYEAWKINKRQPIAFSGPFRLSRTAVGDPA
jgi:hypothetical protein